MSVHKLMPLAPLFGTRIGTEPWCSVCKNWTGLKQPPSRTAILSPPRRLSPYPLTVLAEMPQAAHLRCFYLLPVEEFAFLGPFSKFLTIKASYWCWTEWMFCIFIFLLFSSSNHFALLLCSRLFIPLIHSFIPFLQQRLFKDCLYKGTKR